MTTPIPYEKELVYQSQEVGPINREHIARLIRDMPVFTSSTLFYMDFVATLGYVPKSRADLRVDREKRQLYLENCVFPSGKVVDIGFRRILDGGKLKELSLHYPESHGTQEDFLVGGDALEIVKENMPYLKEAGYEIDAATFKIGHHIVRVPDGFPGFFTTSYGAKVLIATQELIKGKPERKLVLDFTHDVESSNEVRVYREFLESIGSKS